LSQLKERGYRPPVGGDLESCYPACDSQDNTIKKINYMPPKSVVLRLKNLVNRVRSM